MGPVVRGAALVDVATKELNEEGRADAEEVHLLPLCGKQLPAVAAGKVSGQPEECREVGLGNAECLGCLCNRDVACTVSRV